MIMLSWIMISIDINTIMVQNSPFVIHHSSLSEHESFIPTFKSSIIHPSIIIIDAIHQLTHHSPSWTQYLQFSQQTRGHPPLPIAPYLPPSIHRGGSPPLSFPAVHQICPASHSSPTWLFSPPQKVHKIEGCGNPSQKLPSRELTYPTLGKGTSSSKGPWEGIC